MTVLTTYIDHPDQVNTVSCATVSTLIVDMPFCSVRSHMGHDWTNASLRQLRRLSQTLVLNMDGLYTDADLAIMASTIRHRELVDIFDGVRIQDVGLVKWVQTHWPRQHIHLNAETGLQNQDSIRTALNTGIHAMTLNHDIPYNEIAAIRNAHPDASFELYVQGPIVIQYARRRFLHHYYSDESRSIIKRTARDTELPGRLFSFLDTPFGHIMFAHFHRSLAQYGSKLNAFQSLPWLIDARGESHEYLATALNLYTHLFDMTDDAIGTAVSQLSIACDRPQKPGFFLSNNTDYDWRNTLVNPTLTPIGRVLSSKKGTHPVVEFYDTISHDATVVCTNPDQTTTSFSARDLRQLDEDTMPDSVDPLTLYRLPIQNRSTIHANGRLFPVQNEIIQ